jgi:hypothetical protein
VLLTDLRLLGLDYRHLMHRVSGKSRSLLSQCHYIDLECNKQRKLVLKDTFLSRQDNFTHAYSGKLNSSYLTFVHKKFS